MLARIVSSTLISLGLVAGSLAAPIIHLNKVSAANPIDFAKEVKVSGTSWPAALSQSASPSASDTLIFRIYVYNPNPGTTVHNARLVDTLSTGSGTVTNTATFTSTEISYTSSTNVVIPAGKRLNYVQGSTRVYAYNDSVGVQIPDTNGVGPLFAGSGINIGDIPGDDPSGPSGNAKHWYVYQANLVDASTPVIEPAPRMDFTQNVANVTTNSAFANSLTMSDGQTAVFKIWVHNGVTGSVARGEVVKVVLQTAQGTGHTSTATLSTSNAGSFSVTSTLNTATSLGLKYVAGSTKIINHNGNVTAVADVGGTSPLFTAAGLSLGDQQGCFEFEKFVTFQVTTTSVLAASAPVASTLPNTGPESLPILIFSAMVPAGAMIRRIRL